MPVKHLEYEIENGYLQNWLTAGPKLDPITRDLQVQESLPLEPSTPVSEVMASPIERAAFQLEGQDYRWENYRCQEDHLVHYTLQASGQSQARAWAYTKIQSPTEATVSFCATARGAIEIWLNGEQVYRDASPLPERTGRVFSANLKKDNEILVRLTKIASGADALNFSLQLVSLPANKPESIKVRIPTQAKFPHRYQKLEKMLDNSYLEDVVHYQGAHFNLRWVEGFKEDAYFEYHVEDAGRSTYVEGKSEVDWEKPVDVGHTYRLFERPYWVALTATAREYWDQGLRYTLRLPVHVLDEEYSATPHGHPYLRRLEALKAASKYEQDIFSFIACMELEQWTKLKNETVLAAIAEVKQQETGCEASLLGLLVLGYRYQTNPSFPQELVEPFQDCLLNFDYSPSLDGKLTRSVSESSSLLISTCELLSGQRLPDATFFASGQKGAWHRKNGETRVLEWMHQRAQTGFSAWNSTCDWPGIMAALAQITTLAEAENVAELAAVLLDKMLFLLAVQSFKGTFGTTHGSSGPGMLKSSQLEATSGITRLLWGAGVFNHHILGTVSLACSDYEYPAFLFELAKETQPELQHKECFLSGGEPFGLVTYKTPDFMLSSVQDYRPGQAGDSEHIWQATFGSEARVFVTHPACSSENPAYQPGFWSGNAILPRTAQWKDVLISVHNIPVGDWMGFTHAYFPIPAFDEYKLVDNWAFLKKDDGYLALTAQAGLSQTLKGLNTYRELRSYGLNNIWVCQLGRAARDGSFADFQQKVLQAKLEWQQNAVKYTSLRQEEIAFGWNEPLQVNGNVQPFPTEQHIENPYCTVELPARFMDINYGDIGLRLNFE